MAWRVDVAFCSRKKLKAAKIYNINKFSAFWWNYEISIPLRRIFSSIFITFELPDIDIKLNTLNMCTTTRIRLIDENEKSFNVFFFSRCDALKFTYERLDSRVWMECEKLNYWRIAGTRVLCTTYIAQTERKVMHVHARTVNEIPMFCIDPSHSMSRWNL